MSNALHIFAATDHSPQGNFAVARAFALAALEHSPLQLLQVLNQSLLQRLQELLGQEGDLLQEQLHGDARQRLQTLAEQLDQGQSQRVECHVLHGSVVGSLLEHLQQHPCDLLVLGAQGENALRHLLLGSTAARLLNHCREPLLVVRQPVQRAYQRVLLAVDFSPWSSQALHLAQRLAPGAELILLHAFEAPFEGKLRFAGVDEATLQRYAQATRADAEQRMLQLCAQADSAKPLRSKVLHGDAGQLILEQAELEDCDLIVLGKQGQGALQELLLGSVSRYVLNSARCDVLVSGA